MGLYNTFVNGDDVECQMKVGYCDCSCFSVGSSVVDYDIADGVYLTPEGVAVVIVDQKVVAITPSIRDKWGKDIHMKVRDVVANNNPVLNIIKKLQKQLEKEKRSES